MTVDRIKWTLEDYHRMVEASILDGRPVELLQGEIIDMAPEGGACDLISRYFSGCEAAV